LAGLGLVLAALVWLNEGELMKIGIPSALIMKKHPKLWTTFFEELALDVVSSGKTTQQIMDLGLANAEDETCLPMKCFVGHCLALKGNCDLVFVPRYFSLYKGLWGCPKFFAPPDMVENIYDTPVLTVMVGREYDSKIPSENSLEEALAGVGEELGKDEGAIQEAIELAISTELQYQNGLWDEYFERISSREERILLVSHEYILDDDFLNMGIADILREFGVEPISIETVPFEYARRFSEPLFWMKWDFGVAMMERLKKALQHVQGAIQLTTFGCGPDSFLVMFVKEECDQARKPYMKLMLDEHSSRERMRTRIEAFLDTLAMRR